MGVLSLPTGYVRRSKQNKSSIFLINNNIIRKPYMVIVSVSTETIIMSVHMRSSYFIHAVIAHLTVHVIGM